jgi:hypothetical protein
MDTNSNSPVTGKKPWHEDGSELRRRREALGVSAARLSRVAGRHESWVAEIESGRILLTKENGADDLWDHLAMIEIEAREHKARPLAAALGAPEEIPATGSRADLMEEIRLLREQNRTLGEMLQNEREISSCLKELAELRAERIRGLKTRLGEDPDADDGEE